MQNNVKEISDNDLRRSEALFKERHRLQKMLKEVQIRIRLTRENYEYCYEDLPEYKSLASKHRRLSYKIKQVNASINKNKKKRMKIKINSR
ncbi:MAG: hypothetical protein ACUZ8I_18090 [Candidatus Scalindua sp.]